MKLKTAAEIKAEIVTAIANCHADAPLDYKTGWEGEWMDVAQRAAEGGDEWFIDKLGEWRLADKGTSKNFFLTTAPTANHTILGWAKTAAESVDMALVEIERERLDIDPDDLDTNEVRFTVDEDGEVEELVRVDGLPLLWELGGYTAGRLARDITVLSPGLI